MLILWLETKRRIQVHVILKVLYRFLKWLWTSLPQKVCGSLIYFLFLNFCMRVRLQWTIAKIYWKGNKKQYSDPTNKDSRYWMQMIAHSFHLSSKLHIYYNIYIIPWLRTALWCKIVLRLRVTKGEAKD